METLVSNQETTAYKKASKRVKELKEFYGNFISFCLVISFLALLNLMTSPGYLWFLWPMLGWGIGLVFHVASVFGVGKNWEEKKVRELIEKERKNQN